MHTAIAGPIVQTKLLYKLKTHSIQISLYEVKGPHFELASFIYTNKAKESIELPIQYESCLEFNCISWDTSGILRYSVGEF